MKNIIDSHVHLDLIAHHHPHRLKWLKENDCSVVSWSYFAEVPSVPKLKECLAAKAQCINKLSAEGLACYYLAGIHPRSIPPDLHPEQIKSLLKPYLDDPLCKGIGEIGLETGKPREQEIFMAQLELGRILPQHGKSIGIHTPRSNKSHITSTTLDILNQFHDISSLLVIDHCTIDTIDAVLNAGFWAGVTLSPPKTSWDELKRIAAMNSDQIDRIMCNTDSGSVFFEDVVQFSHSDNMSEAVRTKLFYDNAAQCFTI